MVQRKLTLQLHHAQTQPRAFPFHHEAKSPRGADLKAKKMKKSGSLIKRPKSLPATPPPLCKTTPNYMKSTSSSNARKEQSQSSRSDSSSPKKVAKKPSFKAARKFSSVLKLGGGDDVKRATCSSTLKDCKFPALLPLNPSGQSAVKVCPYTYCSLNGRHHPPLSTFLSAARRTRARSPPDEDDFFVKIYTAARDQEERFSEEVLGDSFDGSDMDWETGYGYGYGYGALLPKYDHYETDAVEIKEEGKDCCGVDEVFVDEEAQESVDEDGGFVFSSSDDDDAEFDQIHNMQISAPTQQVLVQEEEEEETKDEENHIFSDAPTKTDDEEEETKDEENHIFSDAPTKTDDEEEETKDEENHIFSDAPTKTDEEAASTDDLNLPHEEVVASDEAEGREEIAEDISGLLEFAAKSKRVIEEGDESGEFNPRAPNFLDVEAEAEAERVDLRHQDLDERRNSEEWMVDYALRQVVTKLDPAKKRKVALLVEAFEKVMPLPLPPTKFDDLHLSHASRFDQPRPMQACS